jgi:hypothetical protein
MMPVQLNVGPALASVPLPPALSLTPAPPPMHVMVTLPH